MHKGKIMNIINKKNVLFFSLTTLMINGCVAKNELEVQSQNIQQVVNSQTIIKTKVPIKSSWGRVSSGKSKKEDCIDCYAVPFNHPKSVSNLNNSFGKSSNKLNVSSYPRVANNNKVKMLKHYGNYGYEETASDTTVKTAMSKASINQRSVPALLSTNSSQGSFRQRSLGHVAIQVGAFRKYNGAKVFAGNYNALSDRYNVSIKTEKKNSQPLYKVRIEGFNNKSEAKKFMYSYGISDGFLVRK
ncbi:MAG: Unknown protein [uncultured Sulfurovum sp.]|uniref:SPOR domain-containing protein n=1 Tax=uncultured Sulfurovum sp. TaxID=269237 RepID=A0A6S6TH98_9BACT|nr:MAG: Unknown protein [uncultured Sulfurovum sp.]